VNPPVMNRRTDVVRRRCGGATPPVFVGPGSDVGPASTYEPDGQMNDWPLRSYLPLGALPTAIACARLHVKQVLWEWGLEEFIDTAELVVSELTTNALKVSVGLTGSRLGGQWRPGVPPVRLWLCSDKEKVLIQVWDGDERMPEPQSFDLDAESGRGLLLVESLSQEWGAYRPEGDSGKCVWAVL
jgi:Histidine kinase-like ATPase domain